MKVFAIPFSKLVALKRMQLGKSLRDIADKIQKSESFVSEIESASGGKKVSNKTISAFRLAFEITDQELKDCQFLALSRDDLTYSVELEDKRLIFNGGKTNSLRLWGASFQSITEDALKLEYEHRSFPSPVESAQGYKDSIRNKTEDAASKQKEFFNGPCVRLLRFSARASAKGGTAAENIELSLDLGPISWHQYTFLNERIEEAQPLKTFNSPTAKNIGLRDIVESGDLRLSNASNILDTATTVVTVDGFVGYQVRSNLVSADPGKLTSAVAENMNRWMDESDPSDYTKLLDPTRVYRKRNERADHTFVPYSPPNPFATVRRGLDGELTEGLSSKVTAKNLRLLGLSYDLETGHPSALFALFLEMTADQLTESTRQRPGHEHDEGRLRFLEARFSAQATIDALTTKSWTAGGKASLIRAIEFVEVLKDRYSGSFSDVFRDISNGSL